MFQLLRSRVGIILVFGAALLTLDLGRSIWARVALATPSAAYQPNPAQYADLTWPPGADLDRNSPLGVRVFAQRCAVCHGPDGNGNGPAAPSMFPRPRDFSSGIFNTNLRRLGNRRPMKTYYALFATAFRQVRCHTLPVYFQPRSWRRSFSRLNRSPRCFPGKANRSQFLRPFLVRLKAWPAARRSLPLKGATDVTARMVAAAKLSMMDLVIRCLPAISPHHGHFEAVLGAKIFGCV